MDSLEYRCLAGSSSTGKNTERVMERHLHALLLSGVQLQPRVSLEAR